MQTIHRTAPTANFTQLGNEFIAATMPLAAYRVIVYLLSKPLNWRMQRNELKKTLNLTGYKVQQALKWLQLNGYAYFTRFCGRTTWHFTDTPRTDTSSKQPTTSGTATTSTATIAETATSRVNTECIEIQHVENRHVLQITETETNKTTTTPHNLVTPETAVVVECELIYPVQLPADKHGAAKHKLKKLKQPELSQPVLFALAYAMAQGTVKSPIAYLAGIVTAANNGGFTSPVDTAGATKASKPLIPLWQGHKPPPKVDNESFFAELKARYGSKAAKAIPAS